MAVVYFKPDDDGDGTYEGQMGHAYLHPDDDAAEDREHDLGFVTLARALEIAAAHGAEMDIDVRRARSGKQAHDQTGGWVGYLNARYHGLHQMETQPRQQDDASWRGFLDGRLGQCRVNCAT